MLCQAIEDVQLVLPQAIGDSCLVSSYWGITICRGLRCVKLLGITMRRVLQLLGDLRFAGFCVVSSFCRFQLARYCFAPSYWGILLKTPLIWRDRFIIFLKHAHSFGDPASSCIFNTPFHVAIPAHHISSTRSLLWSFPFIIMYLKHAPLVAIPVHHIP